MQLKPRLRSVSAETSDKRGQELFNHGIFCCWIQICPFLILNLCFSVSWLPQLQACLMEQRWQTCRCLPSFSHPVILFWLKPHFRGLLAIANVLISLVSSFCCYEDVGSVSQRPPVLSLLPLQWWKSASKTSLSLPSVVFCWHLMGFVKEQMQHCA